MPEFLFELGTEELPASFVRRAYTDLLDLLAAKLESAGVLRSPGTALGTPRRLIIHFPDLSDRQADSTKQQRGPALKAGYTPDGDPTPALLGFCRSQGIDVADLQRDDQYVWANKNITGRMTGELLEEIVPQAVRSMSFEKSMRWGEGRMRFARPIRWIVALFDGNGLDFEIEGVRAGTQSRGHRFYCPELFEATSFAQLIKELRHRSVEADPEVRSRTIREGAERVTEGTPILTDDLVEENTFLTEAPAALEGSFREEYLVLPRPVLVTAMAKHERMFPVVGKDGNLSNRFVFIRNSGEDETVRRGSEWVLNARFNDAKFFFDEDAKFTLDDFLDRTSGIVFQQKLGSVRQRADRLSNLTAEIARSTGGSEDEISFAAQAGLLCKADLSSGLVSELASLQGVIGGEYARREGLPEPVCAAIAGQYNLESIGSLSDSADLTTARLIIADALDKLAGFLGSGLVPSGSSDPYGLRRAATNLIEIAWQWSRPLPSFFELLSVALLEYEKQGFLLDTTIAFPALADVFAGRYPHMLPEVRHDLLDAAMLAELRPQVLNPRAVRFRTECLAILANDVEFVQTATRPMNIVISARKKSIEFAEEDPLMKLPHSALESAEGLVLLQVLTDIAAPLRAAELGEKVDEVVRLLRTLQQPINDFFESTMVMADQPDVRYARLSLMHACSLAFLAAGDFTKVVIEGVA